MNRWNLTACAACAFLLGSCTFFHKAKPEPAKAAAETAAAEKSAEAKKKPEPTAEQQAAARSLLGSSPVAVAAGETASPAEAPAPGAPAGLAAPIPGQSLRMGAFAPPEEAASAGGTGAPAPNSAERHGLRSLSLPSSLPMDINGKLTPAPASAH